MILLTNASPTLNPRNAGPALAIAAGSPERQSDARSGPRALGPKWNKAPPAATGGRRRRFEPRSPRDAARRAFRRRFWAAFGGPGVAQPAPARSSADGFRLFEAAPAQAQILPPPAPAADALGYDGATPGPLLRLRKGEEVKLRLINKLSEPTTLMLARPAHRQRHGRRRRLDAAAGSARRELRLPLHAAQFRLQSLSPARRRGDGGADRARPLRADHRRRGIAAAHRPRGDRGARRLEARRGRPRPRRFCRSGARARRRPSRPPGRRQQSARRRSHSLLRPARACACASSTPPTRGSWSSASKASSR